MIWTPGLGMRDLQSWLQSRFGMDLPGWQLSQAEDIDHAGRTIVGWGRNPDGNTEGFVLVLPERCAADLDADWDLTLLDFLAFQNAFATGSDEADFDGDGELTLFDFLAFQNAFVTGC